MLHCEKKHKCDAQSLSRNWTKAKDQTGLSAVVRRRN
jgi:hypothetical protein